MWLCFYPQIWCYYYMSSTATQWHNTCQEINGIISNVLHTAHWIHLHLDSQTRWGQWLMFVHRTPQEILVSCWVHMSSSLSTPMCGLYYVKSTPFQMHTSNTLMCNSSIRAVAHQCIWSVHLKQSRFYIM